MKFLRTNRRRIVLALIFIGLFLRVSLSLDPYLHKWDERYHALVAKHLVDNPAKPVLYKDALLPYDYKAWYSNHIWLHKQPLPLYLIALSYKVCGANEIATRIPSILFSTLAIYVLYLFGRYLFNWRVGLLAAFFMAINGLIVEMCSGRIATDHYDTLFMCFILLGMYFAYRNAFFGARRWALISGLFIGMAIITKWLPGLIVLPVHVIFLWCSRIAFKQCIKSVAVSLITCIVIALPWQLFILYAYPNEAKWEYYHNWMHITSALDAQTGSWFYFLDKIRINYSEIIYLPLLYLLYVLIQSKFRDGKYLALFVWIILPLVFFSLAKTKMQGYVMFIAPALFLITSELFFKTLGYIRQPEQGITMKIAGYLLIIAMIVLPVRYCFERTGFGFKALDDELAAIAVEYKRLDIPKRAVVLGVSNPIEFMFYNDCIAYSDTVVTKKDKAIIRKEWYSLYRYENSKYVKIK